LQRASCDRTRTFSENAQNEVPLLSALPPLKTFIYTVTWHHG
jgi:hypothetical protein